MIVGARCTRRVELVLEFKDEPFAQTTEPARNFATHRPQNPPKFSRRNKPPSKRRRDRERKEAWIRKKSVHDTNSLDAPATILEETSSMLLGVQQQ